MTEAEWAVRPTTEETLIDLCQDLVASESVSPPGDTRRAAAVVAMFLEDHGIATTTHTPVPEMPSVVATIGSGERQLIFNGHLDTMEPGPLEQWTVDPFELTERDGRLYGLGMGNMKGAVAAMCVAFAEVAKRESTLDGRLTLMAVADEVLFGPNGTEYLLGLDADLRGDAVLVGEGPGFMRMANAEKGVLWLELSASAPPGHSSRATPATSAIARLANVITSIDAMSGRVVELPAALGITAVADPGERMLTVNVGVARGGTTISQMPTSAVAGVDIRVPPGLTIDEVETEIRSIAATDDVNVDRIKGWDPSWTDHSHPFTMKVRSAVERIRGQDPTPTVRFPASDGSRWRNIGVPVVCYGPQPTHSAGVDDYAERRDVIDCMRIYERLALDYLATAT